MTTPLPCLYGEEFATDPHAVYAQLRAVGPVAWAAVATDTHALVVTSHQVAIQLLNDTATFSKDARRWQALRDGQVPPDSQALALMAWRPSMLYADGDEHARLRTTVDACLARVQPHRLEETTRAATRSLLNPVDPAGHADLVTDVADTVPLLVFADLLGCPHDLTARLVDDLHGLIEAGDRAQRASQDLNDLLAGLIDLKGHQPGEDLTTWLMRHPAALSVQEIIDQLVLIVGAGTIPTSAWIVHAMRLLLDEDAYAGSLGEGTLAVHRALEKALWTKSPMAVFSWHYARHDTVLGGVQVPAGVPIGIAHAAVNQDPALPTDLDYANRGHLAWSVGPHRCPAISQATVIARTAIETIWDRLRDLRVTQPASAIPNRYGPFHQCPMSLPVAFEPSTAESSRGAAR